MNKQASNLSSKEQFLRDGSVDEVTLKPFLKWAGGKRQLLSEIVKYVPQSIGRYYEPFVGAGAVFLNLMHPNTSIGDSNAELVNCYRVIKRSPEALISTVNGLEINKENFYRVRELDRDSDAFAKLTPVERAARIIFLNKTCFNGLFRVNKKGQFNVPYGKYVNPKLIDAEGITAISRFLNTQNVEIAEGDFEAQLRNAQPNDFVYFDPPYVPLTETSSFKNYGSEGFSESDQIRLKNLALSLVDRDVNVLLSNSSADLVYQLYSLPAFEIIEVKASRNINSVGSKRSKVSELLIRSAYPNR